MVNSGIKYLNMYCGIKKRYVVKIFWIAEERVSYCFLCVCGVKFEHSGLDVLF